MCNFLLYIYQFYIELYIRSIHLEHVSERMTNARLFFLVLRRGPPLKVSSVAVVTGPTECTATQARRTPPDPPLM